MALDGRGQELYLNPMLIAELEVEIRHALTIHRPLPVEADPVRCAAILAEEAGEVLKAALDATRRSPILAMQVLSPPGGPMGGSSLRAEIRQTAAVAILWMYGMDKLEEMRRANLEAGIDHPMEGEEY